MGSQKSDSLVIMAVGDVHVNRPDPASAFSGVASVLEQGDINLGNLEGLMCDRGEPIDGKLEVGSRHLRSAPSNIAGLSAIGFKCMAMANNHNMDYGPQGMLQTMELLDQAGIAHAGSGHNLTESHKPGLVEKNGLKLAMLSYTSIYPPVGYAAEENRPGLATLKVHTAYEAAENVLYQPGFPPIVITIPDPIDTELMLHDIREAKKTADLVIVYPHWGVSWGYGRVIGYQKMLGRAAIDAGADAVFGAHPHRLLGMEMYNGKLICYSLGNFILEGLNMPHFGWDTVVVKSQVQNKQIVKFSLVPAKIDVATYRPSLLNKDGIEEVAKSLETMSEEFGTTFTPQDEEIAIGGPKPGTPPPLSGPAVMADSVLPLPYLTGGKPYAQKGNLALLKTKK